MSASDGSVKIKAVLEYDGQDHESEELELEIVGESIPPNLDVSNSTVIFVPVTTPPNDQAQRGEK